MVEATVMAAMVRATMVRAAHGGSGTTAGATARTGTAAGAGAGTRHCGADAGADKRRCKDEFFRVHCFTSCCVVHVERHANLAELTPLPKNHIG